jgi:hypothetical protein
VEEQRVEGCEGLDQWRLQMQASRGRIPQRGSGDKRIDLAASDETFAVVLRLARSALFLVQLRHGSLRPLKTVTGEPSAMNAELGCR